MRKLIGTLALAAACMAASASAERAEAAPVPAGPLSLRAAIDASDVTEPAHCRPGRPHHRTRPYDGCYRVQRSAPVVRPAPPPQQRPVPELVDPYRYPGSTGWPSLHEY